MVLSDYRIITPRIHNDSRGCFYESYNARIANKIGNPKFEQMNTSVSKKGVLRGLHYQWNKPCGKLISVLKGEILDVIVDIRPSSDQYGTVSKFELSDKNKKILWIPPGYAHGFVAISDEVIVTYMVTSKWNKKGEGCIDPLDGSLNIGWKFDKSNLIISDKDKAGISFSEYKKSPRF